jgi:hypothetical protein
VIEFAAQASFQICYNSAAWARLVSVLRPNCFHILGRTTIQFLG